MDIYESRYTLSHCQVFALRSLIMILLLAAIFAAVAANDWHEATLSHGDQLLTDLIENHPSAQASSTKNRDKFGVEMIFPSVDANSDWYASWEQPRFIGKSNMEDVGDERTMSRGNGSLSIGYGEMVMNGEEPRYYIQAPAKGWTDTEFTVYFLIDSWIDPDKAAISLISRSRHHHIHQDPCEARGYYARFYFQNHRIQLKKEFRHDASGTVIYSPGIETIKPLDSDFDLKSHYLGIKSVVTTNPDGQSVKLRIYFDLSEGKNGGTWQLLLDYDDRDLEALQPTGCEYDDAGERGDSSPIFRPGQVSILRADSVNGLHLRSASVRAI